MKYRTRAVWIGGDYEDPGMTADEVWEDDRDPEDTGLVTSRGDRIYRQRETVPFGFVGSKTRG